MERRVSLFGKKGRVVPFDMVVDPMTQPNLLERYEILNELGRGAIGRVYAARDRSAGAVVALKTLDPALFSVPDASVAELFLKDARSAARLRHRNIVKVHDAGEAGGTAYVAMELLEGRSLRSMLDERPLPIARAIQIFDDIASALAYAHEEGVVHRGVKPSNIIVLRSGAAKIGDFGIGRLGEAALLAGQRGGCLSYMSPEQLRADPVDHRSDLFSLGAVFYEMLTRRAPFEGNSPKEITQNILHAEPPLPSKVNPHVPFALDRIVISLLAAHPDDRFANARLLLRDLQRLEEELGMGPGASAGTNEPAKPAAPQPATKREPGLQARDTSGLRFLRDPSPAEEFQHRSRIPASFAAFDEHDARFIMDREAGRERSSESRAPRIAALVLLLAALPIGYAGFLYYSPGPSEPRTPVSRMKEAPAAATTPSPSIAPPPVAEATKDPATAPTAPAASPPAIASAPNPLPPKPILAEPSAPAKAEPPPAKAKAEKEAPRAAQPTANISEPQPGGTAKLVIAIAPQGEVYVNGKHYGATPPITTLDLEPGMHRIEIRSGSRKPYVTYMTVEAGDLRRIRHDFAAKDSRPPS